MAVTDVEAALTPEQIAAIQQILRERALDGWLLYDFRGMNSIATGLLGIPALTRRFLVLIPAHGKPIALTHVIEQQPWRAWSGENRTYLGWESFERGCARLLNGLNRLALEYSQGDAVPYLDRIPAGVLELVRKSGVVPVSSGDLVSAFHSRWSPEGLSSHLKAAAILRATAFSAFDRIGELVGTSGSADEWDIRQWIAGTLASAGLSSGVDSVVATGPNAANPHYAPGAGRSSAIRRGDLVLIDLWGKLDDDAIFADQTWIGYVGNIIPPRVQTVWEAVRDARDAAVTFITKEHKARRTIGGFAVDDVARGVIAGRGFGDAFIHRTGHSIDRDLHGSGPNIDNLETRDTRTLIGGIGFSIEPGIYIEGEIGIRSEIDVYMSAEGPQVTTPEPQAEIHLIRVPG